MRVSFILEHGLAAARFMLACAVLLSPDAIASTVRINEVMASNGAIIADEDGDFEDWIELCNYGAEPVNLGGWGLSDSYDNPFKWVFPADVSIGPGEYLLVWASGKDRTGPSLHANFSLAATGEEVLLSMPDGTGVDYLPPIALPRDVSIGRSQAEPDEWVMFADPTPGQPNAGPAGHLLSETVSFSEPARMFTDSIVVALDGATSPDQDIRYTTDRSVPTVTSARYQEALSIDQTTIIRARVFDAHGAGGRVSTQHYVKLAPELAARRSHLPMVVLDPHGQSIPNTASVSGADRAASYFMLFDRDAEGISALSALPEIAVRQGMRYRGSSSYWGSPKNPYAVEFWDEDDHDLPMELLGMAADSDWVFYNGYNFDRTFVRNSFIRPQ